MRLPTFLAVAALTCYVRLAAAIPAPDVSQPVPIARLIKNVSNYIRKHPKDPQGYYTLARIHSIAFAQSFIQPAPTVTVYRGTTAKKQQTVSSPQKSIKAIPVEEAAKYSGKQLPEVSGFGILSRDPKRGVPTSEDLYHLRESVRFYTKATALAPQDRYAWLGYAWVLEQGVPYAARLGSPWVDTPSKRWKSRPADWADRAIAAYRRAYQNAMSGYKFDFYDSVLVEAGEGILRVQAPFVRQMTSQERAERERIQRSLVKVKKAPMIVSPIILPLGKSLSLKDLLSHDHSVQFDLAGDGQGRRWPWVGSETGILVWDPEHKGSITSGRQLFGSITWWVFWKNGYQALAALDNNADGSLSGPELQGISIWRDANGNGISDPDEVKPVAQWGIVSLSTQATLQIDGMPANLQGATTKTGDTLPTYDWVPRSLN